MGRTALSRPRLSAAGLTYSLSFDGVADRAQSAANAGISGTAACSLVGWFKTQENIITDGKGYLAAGEFTGFTTGVGPGILVVGEGPGNLIQSPFLNSNTFYKVPVDRWLHIAITYAGGAGGERILYINGSPIFTGVATGAATNGKIQIGATVVTSPSVTLYTKTKYGPFAIYTDVLTQTEIENIYANQAYPSDNAVGIYKLTEGSGTTIADTSGNGRNITVAAGAPVWSASDLPVVGRTVAGARTAISQTRTPVS